LKGIPSIVFGVRHNEAPLSFMWGTDTASRKYERPAGVSCTFQVSNRNIEPQTNEPSNIFSKDPIGPELLHNSKHFRPEVTVIVLASTLPGCRERLAGKPA
jgi:hypothetical protein